MADIAASPTDLDAGKVEQNLSLEQDRLENEDYLSKQRQAEVDDLLAQQRGREADDLLAQSRRAEFEAKFPGFQYCGPVDRPVFRTDRHSFRAPLKFQIAHPQDHTFFTAQQEVAAFNEALSPLERFADHLVIEALNAAPTSFYEWGTSTAVHALTRVNVICKVQLKLVRDRDQGWFESKVMVRDGDRWILFKHFLDTNFTTGPHLSGSSGYRLQLKWWKGMGRPFKFSVLPTELQDKILAFAIGERVEPRVEWHDGRGFDAEGRMVGTNSDYYTVAPRRAVSTTTELATSDAQPSIIQRLTKATSVCSLSTKTLRSVQREYCSRTRQKSSTINTESGARSPFSISTSLSAFDAWS